MMGRNLRMSDAEYSRIKKARNPDPLPRPSEHAEQAEFFKWWRDYAALKKLSSKLCFAIPNAGALSGAGRIYMWREGLTAGVCDIFMAIPRGGFHGAFCEMKRRPNQPSDEQKVFISSVSEMNYNVCVAYSCDEAIKFFEAHLNDEAWKR